MQSQEKTSSSFALHSFTNESTATESESIHSPKLVSSSSFQCSLDHTDSSRLLQLDSPSPPLIAASQSSFISHANSKANHANVTLHTNQTNSLNTIESQSSVNEPQNSKHNDLMAKYDPFDSVNSSPKATTNNDPFDSSIVNVGPTSSSCKINQATDTNLIDADLLTSADFYLQFKTRPDDSRSNKSVTTSKSTRQIFDLMARVLPVGVLLLILMLMLHFVLYVRDLEPYKSISEVACKALAASVIPLSIVFILRIVCDCNRTMYAPETFDSIQDPTPPPTAHLYAYATELPRPSSSASTSGALQSNRLMQICVPVITTRSDPHPTPT